MTKRFMKKYLQMTWSVPIVWQDKFWDEQNKKDSYLCLVDNKFIWTPNELKVTMKEKKLKLTGFQTRQQPDMCHFDQN